MKNDFTKTPSFYNNQETFKKYLGKTSYYLGLQEKLLSIVKLLKPVNILELGFGTGQTAIRVAKANPNAQITALDLREEMASVAKELAVTKKVHNIDFVSGDMSEYVKGSLSQFDIVYLLYSFHHVEDPLDKKIEFLNNCYCNMKTGACLCVAETFIPENNTMDGKDSSLIRLWEERGDEGYASTFWKSLKSLKEKDLSAADNIASYCRQMEVEAGRLVVCRKDEYLVKRSWLKKQAELQGFNLIIDKETNILGDAVMLFKKDECEK